MYEHIGSVPTRGANATHSNANANAKSNTRNIPGRFPFKPRTGLWQPRPGSLDPALRLLGGNWGGVDPTIASASTGRLRTCGSPHGRNRRDGPMGIFTLFFQRNHQKKHAHAHAHAHAHVHAHVRRTLHSLRKYQLRPCGCATHTCSLWPAASGKPLRPSPLPAATLHAGWALPIGLLLT